MTLINSIKESLEGVINGPFSSQIITLILLFSLGLLAVAAYYIAKMILNVLEKVILRSPTEWDGDMFNPCVHEGGIAIGTRNSGVVASSGILLRHAGFSQMGRHSHVILYPLGSRENHCHTLQQPLPRFPKA